MFERIKKPISMLIIISFAFLPINGYAQVAPNQLPTGGAIQGGAANGTISETADTMTVDQNVTRMIADWETFNVGSSATVNFDQDSASWVALNRIADTNPSEIFGSINALGQIFLINQNGIVFQPGSQVDVAGLIASTLSVGEADFKDGNYSYLFSGDTGAIINNGTLNAPGGYIGLLGTNVTNGGSIVASTGKIALAAGEEISIVGLDSSNLVSVQVDVNESLTGAGTSAVVNTGTIQANGEDGAVLLTADVLNGVFDNAINNTGVIEAEIITLAANGGDIVLTGAQVSATAENVGHAEVNVISEDGDINITDSDLLAQVGSGGGDNDAEMNIYAYGGYVDITDSTVTARVEEEGEADIDIAAYGRYDYGGELGMVGGDVTIDPSTILAESQDKAEIDIDAIGGDLTILDSSVIALAKDAEGEDNSADIELDAEAETTCGYGAYGGDLLIDNSLVKADVAGHGEADIALDAKQETAWDDGVGADVSSGGNVTIQNSKDSDPYDDIDEKGLHTQVGAGEAETDVDAKGGDLTITDSSLVAYVEGNEIEEEGSYWGGRADVNLNDHEHESHRDRSNVDISNSDLEAVVDGHGEATIQIGNTEWSDNGIDQSVTNLSITNGSNLLAKIESGDDTAEIEINVIAGDEEGMGQLLVQGSTLTAEVEDTGHAVVDLDVRGYGTYQRDITIDNSTVEAVVDGTEGGYQEADVNIYLSGYDYGEAPRFMTVKNNSTVKAQVVGNNDSENANADVYMDISGCTDGHKHLSIEDSSVLAQVLDGGSAQIYMYNYAGAGDGPLGETGRLINIDNSNVEALVNVDGTEGVYGGYAYNYLGIYCGGKTNDRRIVINDSDVRAEVNSEQGDSNVNFFIAGFGYGDRTIDITNGSLVEALTTGYGGYSYVGFETQGYNYHYPDSGEYGGDVFLVGEGPSVRSILIDGSTVNAEVVGEGHAEVYMDTQACGSEFEATFDEATGEWTYGWYTDSGDITIQNGSEVIAKTTSGYDSSEIDIITGEFTLDNSKIQAIVTEAGSAEVSIDAYGTYGDYIFGKGTMDEYGDYSYDEYASYGSVDFWDGGVIDVLNGSEISANVYGGYAEVELHSAAINVMGSSKVKANVTNNGDAFTGLYTHESYVNAQESTYVGEEDCEDCWDEDYTREIDFGAINVRGNSLVESKVGNNGDATTLLMAGYEVFDGLLDSLFGDGGDGFSMPRFKGDVSGGDINIESGSVVQSKSNKTEEGDTSITALLALNDISTQASTQVNAIATGEGNPAITGMLAGNSINAQGLTSATSDFLSGVIMLAPGDVAAGNVLASGDSELDVLDWLDDLLDGWMGITLGDQYDYSSAALIASLAGDVTLGNITADAVIAAALGLDFMMPQKVEKETIVISDVALSEKPLIEERDCIPPGDGSIWNADGDVSANFTYLLARNDIGALDNPIATDTNIVAGYSFESGNVVIDQVTDKMLEVGLFLPIEEVIEEEASIETVRKMASIEGYGDYKEFVGIGASLAAKDGIVSVTSEGDQLINSIVSC